MEETHGEIACVYNSEICNNQDEEVEGSDVTCNPRKGYYRYSALFLLCFLGFGSYFCYDSPGALQDHIKQDMNVNTVQFASLYSLYSWPNVVLCFVGGFLIDRVFGIRMGAIIFSLMLTVGQYIFAFGGLFNQFWMMQFGRFIFGIGSESLAVAQNAYTVTWFKGKELNMVFGLLLSMSRVGSTVNFLVIDPIYEWVNTFEKGHVTLGITLLFAGVFCFLSLLCSVFLGLMDRHRSKVLKLEEQSTGEKIQLKDIFSFPLSFWLISLICVTYYVAIFPFIGLAKIFFMEKYDYSESQANSVSSMPYVISAVASPALGFIIDKTGRNIFWVFLAVFITLCCHVLLTFTFLNPFVPMIVMGIAYSLLASSLWPMVSIILPEHTLGTAYGLMQSIQNLGLAVISVLAGLIVDTKGYFLLEIFYSSWLCVALLSCIGIWISDAYSGGILMMSPKERALRSCQKDDKEPLLQTEEEPPHPPQELEGRPLSI